MRPGSTDHERRRKPLLRLFALLTTAGFVFAAALSSPVLPGPYEHGVVVLYLGTAAVFAYVGLRSMDALTARSVIGAMGAFYLLSGVTCAIILALMGFHFEEWGFVISIVHAFVGATIMLCAWRLPSEEDGHPPTTLQ